MSIAASPAFSRTSGIAPLFVFCDGSGTTSTLRTPDEWRDVYHQWTVSGPVSSGNWQDVGQGNTSRDFQEGLFAGFVFETVGTYTITYYCFDGVSVDQRTQQITVDDPASSYSMYYYISLDGTFTGAPGADGTHIRKTIGDLGYEDFDSAINTIFATGTPGSPLNTAIYFQSGQTFAASARVDLDMDGPWCIGKFGSAANPIVTMYNGELFRFGATGRMYDDGRIMDLEFDGQSGNTTIVFAPGWEADNMTILNCSAHHVTRMFNMFGNTLTDHIHKNWCVAKSSSSNIVNNVGISNVNAYGDYVESAFLGNSFDSDLGGEHVMRSIYYNKLLIAHNLLQGAAAGKTVLTLRAPGWASAYGPVPANSASQYSLVRDNRIIGGLPVSICTQAPNAPSLPDRIHHTIWESNQFETIHPDTGVVCKALTLQLFSHGVVRNNLFNHAGSLWNGIWSIHCDNLTHGTWTPDNVKVYNNTHYFPQTADNCEAVTNDDVTNFTVDNELVWAPTVTSPDILNGIGTEGPNNSTAAEMGADTNTGANGPFFAGSGGDGTGTFTTPSHFKLISGSYGIGNGTDGLLVYRDFFGSTRDWQTPNTDMGFHAFTTGSLPAAAAAQRKGGGLGASGLG